MKNIGIVFRFEYLNYAKKKAYLAITLGIILIAALILSWPRISDLFFGGERNDDENPQSVETVTLIDESLGIGGRLIDIYNEINIDSRYVLEMSSLTAAQAEEQVDSGDLDSVVVLLDELKYIRIVRSLGMYDSFDSYFSEIMLKAYQSKYLSSLSIEPEHIQSVLGAQVESEIVNTSSGKDQFSSFIFTYVLIFSLYFAILMYGQFVAGSVATEKSTRAMELLITSTSPKNLMFGKVLVFLSLREFGVCNKHHLLDMI